MSDKIHNLGSGFWNIRGSFRIGGVLNIGTQCSLIKLASGRFIFLDSYALTGDVRDEVMALTNNGENVEAVLNVHPFHTVHCAQMAKTSQRQPFTAVADIIKKYQKYNGQMTWSRVMRSLNAILSLSSLCQKAYTISRLMR